ncbi:MAG: phasin family protein [Planctomycetota bacterium]
MLQEAKEKWAEQLKKIIRASVGGTMLVQEEIEEFISKCVERGELAEKDGKSLVSDLFKKKKKTTQETITSTLTSLESTIDARIESILKKVHIPTKEDVKKMNEKLEEVLSKLEKLETTSK